ncbi:MAG TPA: 4-hydroxy-tetrahydrodipicolinate reductase [Halobacteriales archaeon]|nr:4-hydroxy-tetrahydrodipicolinate reductase [Halobacteriales archaeon]
MRVAVTGATGRMGGEVIRAAHERGIEVALAVNRDPRDQEVAGVVVEPAADLAALLVERNPDVLVDFTGPESSVEYATACAEAGVPVVVGTTGFDSTDEAALDEVGERVPVLRAANFARGVQALSRAVAVAVRALPGYDVEVTETHHNAKRDAPSGTAKELLSVIEAELETTRQVHGRAGEAPRRPGEVGVHARRAGDITGEHEVLLADNHEVLTLTHRAESRGVFAAGALDAAEWLVGREPGRYDFTDVIE